MRAAGGLAARLARSLKASDVGDRLVRRNPLFYAAATRAFDRLESASLDERARFAEDRLRTVLRAARAHTRYGASTGAGDRLPDWPLLEKESVRDDPAAFVGRAGPLAARAYTSGTSGTPLALVRSPRSVAVEQAAIDRLPRRYGVELARARHAVLRADDVGIVGSGERPWRDDLGGRRRVFGSNQLSAATLDSFHEALREFRPACLLAYPSALESLCRLLDEAGLRLAIPLTLTSSEMLSEPARQLAAEVLGTRVVDYYGQAERVAFAYSFEAGAYTFLPGYAVTELLPVETDGETETFEIVGTSLWNLAMPLVRYRTGDLVTLPARREAGLLDEIRLGLRSVPGIAGRDDDFLIAPGGGRLIGVNHVPREVENVLRLQLVQESRELVRVLVLAKPGFGSDDRERISRNLSRKLPPALRHEIEVVDMLEPGARGKTPLVVRRPGV